MLIRDALANLSPRADAEILLAFLLQKPRTWILAHEDDALTKEESVAWQNIVHRRERAEPVAYITGEKEFYGRMFQVNPSTLIPRPATETLIDVALDLLEGQDVDPIVDADTDIIIATSLWGSMKDVATIVDIGTGSGCIGITLACERNDLKMVATDISREALTVAKYNAEQHHVDNRITFLEGDALDPIKGLQTPFFIVTNPPYIPTSITLMNDVQDFEPHEALFAGEKGTDIIEKIFSQAKAHPFCVGVVMECRKEQMLLNPKDEKTRT